MIQLHPVHLPTRRYLFLLACKRRASPDDSIYPVFARVGATVACVMLRLLLGSRTVSGLHPNQPSFGVVLTY